MKKLAEVYKRAIAGAAFVLVLFCGINYYGKFGWFGKFGLEVLIGGILLSLSFAHFLGPHDVPSGEDKEKGND